MTYFFIFLAIAFALAPVYWLMPNPRQRQQARLREDAMSRGLHIKVCQLPQSHRSKVRQEDTQQGVVYRLPWQQKQEGGGAGYVTCIRVDDGNECEGDATEAVKSRIQRELSSLPDYCYGIEYSNAGVGIFWREQGGTEELDLITGALTVLRNELKTEIIND